MRRKSGDILSVRSPLNVYLSVCTTLRRCMGLSMSDGAFKRMVGIKEDSYYHRSDRARGVFSSKSGSGRKKMSRGINIDDLMI